MNTNVSSSAGANTPCSISRSLVARLDSEDDLVPARLATDLAKFEEWEKTGAVEIKS